MSANAPGAAPGRDAPGRAAPALTAMAPRRAAALAALIVATITIGLWVDRAAGFPGQIVVSLAVWAITTALALMLPPALGRRLVACVWISGVGEMVFSLLWGIYDYQFGNVPLFVPPGHALLYLLGLVVAERIDRRFAPLVLAAATPVMLLLAVTGQDLLSLPLFALFALFIIRGRQRALYATMFVIALAMELYGTAMGNWTWRAVAPGTGLPTLNPPLAAGVFYCGLDWLVNRFVSAMAPAGAAPPAPRDARLP
jgi:hypothetical protein